MFLEYQNEMIALIVILVLLVIYLLVKIRKTEKRMQNDFIKEETLEEQVSQELVLEEEKSVDHSLEPQEEDFEEFTGSEEGDFGEVQEEPLEYKRKSDIIKRDVPKHGKITKQNFKEFAGVKILVAEDNLINQKVIAGLLADSGIELTMANDGQEALDNLEQNDDFLLILMDAHMPRVDGFEATKIIRENSKYDHILIVALSGDTAADDIKKMSEAGMEEQLEKPLRMDSLYDILYAYSAPDTKKNESDGEYVEVPMTKELQGDKGLAICGGDEKFYLEILHEFINTYSDSAHQLRSLLTASKEQEADKLLLDIIGVSANIGAEQFTKVANSLKEALSDTDEKSYFTNLEHYQVNLKRLVKDIKNFIEK